MTWSDQAKISRGQACLGHKYQMKQYLLMINRLSEQRYITLSGPLNDGQQGKGYLDFKAELVELA